MYDFSSFKMARETGIYRLNEAKADETYKGQLNLFADALEAELKKISPAIEKIAKDESLSGPGKAFNIARYLVQAWNAIEAKAERTITELEDVAAQISKKITSKPYGYGLENVERLLMAQEVREVLYKEAASNGGTLKLRVNYIKACEDGSDPLFCYAIESAPKYRQILDDSTLARGKATRAEREHPDEIQQIKLLDVLRSAYDYVLYHSKELLKNAGLGAVNYDWGKIEFIPKDGASYEIKLLSLRHVKSVQLLDEHRTTARQAQKAGLDTGNTGANA